MPDLTRHGHRDPQHDYHSRAIYLITVKTAPGAPSLSEITDCPIPESRLLPVGELFLDAIAETFREIPEVRILSAVMMPDHAHLVIFVQRRIRKSLGYYIRKIKGLATSRVRSKLAAPDMRLFIPDFHDRILRGPNQLEAMIRYVADNPRRLAVKRKNPELFTIRRSITSGGHDFSACGNIFLLDDFDMMAVRIHRRWDSQTLEREKAAWRQCAVNGGTLISPFIHPVEKEMMRECIDLGARIILLTNEPMDERYKPGGKYFDLCARGRLLVLNPVELPPRKLQRADALIMNAIAADIAASRTV